MQHKTFPFVRFGGGHLLRDVFCLVVSVLFFSPESSHKSFLFSSFVGGVVGINRLHSMATVCGPNPGPGWAQARPRAWAQAEPGENHGILLVICYCMQNVGMYGERVRAHARAQARPEPRPRAGPRPSPAKIIAPC